MIQLRWLCLKDGTDVRRLQFRERLGAARWSRWTNVPVVWRAKSNTLRAAR